MPATHLTWTIVLAGGSGSRLAAHTKGEDGRTIPKQFWSVRGGATLLGGALARATSVAAVERVIVVVAPEHREYWEPELAALPPANIVVQPRDRGTAVGVLLALLTILARERDARVVVMPASQHVEREQVLAVASSVALRWIGSDGHRVVLLGVRPQSPVGGHAWIVPTSRAYHVQPVDRFVAEPEPGLARLLVLQDALWSCSISVGRAQSFLDIYARRHPALLSALAAAASSGGAKRGDGLESVYANLTPVDFSRDILQGSESRSATLEVPACGWSELGTLEQVLECLRLAAWTSAREEIEGSSGRVLARAFDSDWGTRTT